VIRLFAGYDAREAIGFHVFVASVLEHASVPVAIHALDDKGLPHGSNAFTYSRFLVPWLCGYDGHAIFADGSDMLMLADIAELDELFDPSLAVQVVQHPNYLTQHPRKYVGTRMECENRNYARKNWASLMLLNCAHPYWRSLEPRTLERFAGLSLLQFGGLRLGEPQSRVAGTSIVPVRLQRSNHYRAEVGALPDAWNRLCDEGQPVEGAKLLHWTAGIPAFSHYQAAPGADRWYAAHKRVHEGMAA
jgi:hypothetical protein